MTLVSTRYAFASAYLKGEESKVMTADHVDAILQKSSIQDALEVIRNTDVGSYLWERPIKTFDDVDEYLWMYLGGCLERLEWLRPPSDIMKISSVYVLKYDVWNIKIALRAVLTDKRAPMVPLGVIHNRGLSGELSSAKSLDEIVEVLARCGLRDYADVLRESGGGDIRARLLTELRLDNKYYENMLSTMRKMEEGLLLVRGLGIIIDLINLQIVFRSVIEGIGLAAAEFVLDGGYVLSREAIKELLSLKLSEITASLEHTEYREAAEELSRAYERDSTVTVVDRVIEKHKFRLAKELWSPRVLSPLIMVWYLMVKEFEMRDLRLVFKALIDGMPPAEIKDYLVISS